MKSKIIAIFALTMTMLFGALTSSHAGASSPYANVTVSNNGPNLGDPIAIYLELHDCSVFPTNISVNLTFGFFGGDRIVLDENNSTYKVKKVGSVFQVKWLYRGPVGDGVSADPFEVHADASGGCVTNSADFRDESSSDIWWPVSSFEFLLFDGFFAFPDINGLSLTWKTVGTSLFDESRLYEIQYAIAGTNMWSHPIITSELSYKLRGLTKGTIYDIRIRARISNAIGEWVINTWEPRYRTPAYFEVTSFNVDGQATNVFAAQSTVKLKMKLSDCTIQPAGGSIGYYLLERDSRSYEQFPTRTGIADSQGFEYDDTLDSYKGEFEFTDLPNGTYMLQSFLVGSCGWTLGSLGLASLPRGNDLIFTVGPKVPQVPLWGSATTDYDYTRQAEVTAATSTTATISWGNPENLEDGPFTYTVELLKPNGTVSKVLGTTKKHSFNVSGLSAATYYDFRVLASNSVTTSPEMRSHSTTDVRTANLTVKRGSKLTAAAYAKAVGVPVPSGATLSIAKPAGTFPFTDCKFAKNVVTFNNSVGACTVQLTIKPKKVGKTQPKSIISQHDVMIKR